MGSLHFTHARLVTRNQVIEGDLRVKDHRIQAICDSFSGEECEKIDLQGDFLLPGLIEIHTDNLERHIQPRPGVVWPSLLAAAIAHDVQIVGAGITTVLDALAIGGLREGGLDARILEESFQAISLGQQKRMFKADHAIHLRCEVSDHQMASHLQSYGEHPLVRLLSVMDHTPGQRQWTDLDKWRLYHRDKGWTDRQAEQVRQERLAMQQEYAADNYARVFHFAHARHLPVASHDDTILADVEQSAEAGISIAEFPTTLAAALSARENGMRIVMGAPNVLRGSSHSGNISARILAKEGYLDALSSDYAPASLLHAAFFLTERLELPLHESIAMISANIAAMIGLDDRGEIAEGKRADLIQVSLVEGLPVVRRVWRAGVRVA